MFLLVAKRGTEKQVSPLQDFLRWHESTAILSVSADVAGRASLLSDYQREYESNVFPLAAQHVEGMQPMWSLGYLQECG